MIMMCRKKKETLFDMCFGCVLMSGVKKMKRHVRKEYVCQDASLNREALLLYHSRKEQNETNLSNKTAMFQMSLYTGTDTYCNESMPTV